MKLYQILKVTDKGAYFVGMRSTLKEAVKRAKTIVANANVAPATHQYMREHGVENGFFYASVRLLQNRDGIGPEIWKTDIYHE